MADLIKAERATIKFFEGVEVDGYRMPDGSFRVGLASASLAVGYGKEWLGRTLSRGGNQNKALQEAGFSGETQGLATETIRGVRQAQTISLDDFVALTQFASIQGKAAAVALVNASLKINFTDFFRDGFGEVQLTIEEKRAAFYMTYAATIDWLDEDKSDRDDLILGAGH